MEIKRDDAFLNEIMPKIHEFYKCLLEFTPPDASEKDFVLQESKEWRLYSEILKESRRERKKYEEREKSAQEELIKLSGGQSSQGSGIRLTKCIKRGCVDYGRIEILEDVNLDDYRKKNIEYWRISENE
jgi:predicted transposase YdaD